MCLKSAAACLARLSMLCSAATLWCSLRCGLARAGAPLAAMPLAAPAAPPLGHWAPLCMPSGVDGCCCACDAGSSTPHCCACFLSSSSRAARSSCSRFQYSEVPRIRSVGGEKASGAASKKIFSAQSGCSSRARARQMPPCLPEKVKVGSRITTPCAAAPATSSRGCPPSRYAQYESCSESCGSTARPPLFCSTATIRHIEHASSAPKCAKSSAIGDMSDPAPPPPPPPPGPPIPSMGMPGCGCGRRGGLSCASSIVASTSRSSGRRFTSRCTPSLVSTTNERGGVRCCVASSKPAAPLRPSASDAAYCGCGSSAMA